MTFSTPSPLPSESTEISALSLFGAMNVYLFHQIGFMSINPVKQEFSMLMVCAVGGPNETMI